MTDLTEWLLAQIADDEQVARTALRDLVEGGDGTRWVPAVEAVVVTDTSEVIARTNVDDDKVVRHIARWDPARVLAECAAKQKLIEMHYSMPADEYFADVCGCCDPEAWPCTNLKVMATVYADRPGFREEWRP